MPGWKIFHDTLNRNMYRNQSTTRDSVCTYTCKIPGRPTTGTIHLASTGEQDRPSGLIVLTPLDVTVVLYDMTLGYLGSFGLASSRQASKTSSLPLKKAPARASQRDRTLPSRMRRRNSRRNLSRRNKKTIVLLMARQKGRGEISRSFKLGSFDKNMRVVKDPGI